MNRKGLLSGSESRYKIKLFLEDSNPSMPSNQTYLLNIYIKDTNNSIKEKPQNNSQTKNLNDTFKSYL